MSAVWLVGGGVDVIALGAGRIVAISALLVPDLDARAARPAGGERFLASGRSPRGRRLVMSVVWSVGAVGIRTTGTGDGP